MERFLQFHADASNNASNLIGWLFFYLGMPACLWIAFATDSTAMGCLEPFNKLSTLLISISVYVMLPGLISLIILPTINCVLNSLSILLYPKGFLEKNKISLERYAGNSTIYDTLLSRQEVNFWSILNLVNFFLENFTEAIICVILLFSGYTDIFLTMFAVPTIMNASVRFFKIIVPYTTECLCFLVSEEDN